LTRWLPRLTLATLVASALVPASAVTGAARGPSPLAPKQAVATGAGGAVASLDLTATRAGIDVLQRGGNAIDAAVAVAATLGVTEPYVAGIGGGGFMVIYLASEHRVVTIDGREKAPAAFPVDAFIDPSSGQPIPFYPQRVTTGLAVGVPGTLMTWQDAAARYGSQPLGELLEPAIQAAERGFVVNQKIHDETAQNQSRLAAFTSSRSLYLPGGQPPAVGSVLRNPELARTYGLIAREGIGALYHGPIGEALVDTVQHPPLAPNANLGFQVLPGRMTRSDLAAYTAPQQAPTTIDYRGYQIDGMGPPSSGGSTVGEALNILAGYHLGGRDRGLALFRYLEASRLSFADRNRYLGDANFGDVPLRGLLSPAYAATRRCLIGTTALTSPVPPGNPYPPFGSACGDTAASGGAGGDEGISTNHITVADRFGNVVSYTNTIEQIAGSAIAVPGYGFLLNNELTDFDAAPVYPGQPDPNLPAGNKRPRSSMSPTIVLHDGRPVLAVGSPGGSTIITTVLQILVDYVDFHMSLPDAIAAPRASQRDAPTTQAEPDFIAAYGQELQSRFGEAFTSSSLIGAATGIRILPDGLFQAVAEPVREGGGAAAVVRPESDGTG
jgi:gamma-glutamyltranspeptidase / glutathione hydrolase